MFINVYCCLFVFMHSHDDSEKIQRGTPQKFLVVSLWLRSAHVFEEPR